MRVVVALIVLLVLIYRTDGHGQHGSTGNQPPNGQPHVVRKMEEYVHDVEHIKHDLEGQINKPKEEMTSEEQNFYYFKLHDTNNDNRLDGLEIVAAFDHAHHEENKNNTDTTGQTPPHQERLPDEELIRIVDDILKDEDLNRDGYISYEEFKRAIEGTTT